MKSRSLEAWRVSARIFGLTFKARLEYRADFLLSIAVGVIWQLSLIVFVTVLLGRFHGMGGWSTDAVLIIVAIRVLSHGLYVLLFGRVYTLAHIVQEGRIDGFLLRPLPVYRQVQLSQFPTTSIGDLIVGVSLFTSVVSSSAHGWSWLEIGYLVCAVAGGTLMEAAIFTAISSAALHFPSANYWATWVGELMSTFGGYPLKILPGAISALFTYVVPLAFISYFPAAVLTDKTDGIGVPLAFAAAAPLFGLGAFIGAHKLWNHSLRYYSGVNG